MTAIGWRAATAGETIRPVSGAGTRTGVGSGVGVGTGVGDGEAVGSALAVGRAVGAALRPGAGWLAWAMGDGLVFEPGLPRVVATIAMTTTDAAATPIAPILISRLNAAATPTSHTALFRPDWVGGSDRGTTEDTGRHGMWRGVARSSAPMAIRGRAR